MNNILWRMYKNLDMTETGNLTSVVSPDSNVTSFTYDGSLVTSLSQSGVVNGTISSEYNNDFSIINSTINPSGAGQATIGFTYNDDGQLTAAGELGLEYNTTNGMLTGTELGNVTTENTYNQYGEVTGYVTKYNGNTIYSENYTLDAAGRITQRIETSDSSSETTDYIYNTIGYLTEVKKDGVTVSKYEYWSEAETRPLTGDQNGNRTKYIANGDTTLAVYDDQDRLLSYGSYNYTYDKNGNLTSKYSVLDTTYYSYDNFGNLRSVIKPDSSIIEYKINASNQRIAKVKYPSGAGQSGQIEKKWLYSGGLLPVAEVDSADEIKVLYGPGYIVKGDTTYPAKKTAGQAP